MSMRCLIVDDSPEFLVAAERMLTRQGIAVVGVARDSAQAMAGVAALQPDVVLMDVSLGTESGFALARLIAEAARDRQRAVDVILISTHNREDLLSLIEDSPAAGYLEKAELSARAIQSILEIKRADSP
jgi:DNA-binding NarL/FixJ family response regulator